MIKILIKSFQYNGKDWDYRLYLNSSSIQWELYTFAFDNIYYKALNKQTVFEFDEQKYTVDIEMSTCFCLLINRSLHKNEFEVGSTSECIYSYKGLRYYYKDIIPLAGLKEWNSSKSKECTQIMEKLKEKFNEYQLINWISCNDSRNRDEEELYKTSIIFNRYRYSKFIEHLIERHGLDINSYVPMINYSYSIFGFEDNSIFRFPDSIELLFECDLYPLDIAYLGRNDTLLKKLVQKKAKQHATTCDNIYFNGNINLISSILDISSSKEDIEFAKSLFFNTPSWHTPFYMDGNNYWSINDYDRRVLESWYASIIRLGDIEQLKALITKYTDQIFIMLRYVSPYTAKHTDEDLQEEISKIPHYMLDYINANIIPKINKYDFEDINHKGRGIWGYDARTGKPIKESDLYIK